MQISLTFRNMEGEEWLKDHVDKKIQRLKKYIDKPVEASVILSVEKFRNVAEVKLLGKGVNIVGKEEAKDMITAVDEVVDKIERQLKKHKEKNQIYKENPAKNVVSVPLETAEGSPSEEEPPQIVETRKIVLQPMSVDDAVLQIEGSQAPFVIYRDSATESVSVLYRRNDGNYALIETKY